MKNKILKHTYTVSTLITALLMVTKWFIVDLAVGVERHSFLTIPDLINAAVDFLAGVAGRGVTFGVLLLAGILEYLAFVAAALGVWGVIRTYMKKRKSRLIFVSQCTALSLVIIALVAIVLIDIVSASALGGVIAIYPTVWFVLAALSLVTSFVSGILWDRVD